jgi:HK97 family phage major capsid protein
MLTRSHLELALQASREIAPESDWLRLCRRVNVAQAIGDLTRERKNGAAAEASAELAKRRPLDRGNSIRLPWESLAFATRADVAGTSTTGGYLVDTKNVDSAAASLLSMLVLGRLGASAISSSSNVALPKVNSNATANWLATETSQIPESDLAFGQVNFTPHTVGGYTEISRQLALQSRPDAPTLVASELMRRMRRAIEAAAFNGTGINGQPHGILGTTGVNTASGTTFSLSIAMNAVSATGDALDLASNPGWCCDKASAFLLRQRAEVYGAVNGYTPIWQGPETASTMAGYPSAATSGMPASTAIFGNWRHLVLCDFAGGLEIALNPYGQPGGGQFQAGIVGLHAMATIDVGLVWPSAFTTVTGVT